MALTQMSDFTFKHSAQVDKPNIDADTIKVNFDSRGKEIRDYINGTLKTEVDGKAEATHDHVIGDITGLQTALDGKADDGDITTLSGDITTLSGDITTLSGNITDLAGEGRTTETVKGNAVAIANHQAETVSQTITADRDLSLTGVQTITTTPDREIKAIIAIGSVQATKKWSQGIYAKGETYTSYCSYSAGDTGSYYVGTNILLFSDLGATNRTIGSISNVSLGSFDITWSKSGTGATGTANMRFLVLYHD